jgi:hypothetical protein
MARGIVAGGLAAVVALIMTARVQACGACAEIGRQQPVHQGKLIREVLDLGIEDESHEGERVMIARVPVIRWVLRTADNKTHVLDLGSRTTHRVAQALRGLDVVVTGPLLHNGTIQVHALEARAATFAGTLRLRQDRGWVLATDKGDYDLLLSREASRRAGELENLEVRVTGQMTFEGIVVSSLRPDYVRCRPDRAAE